MPMALLIKGIKNFRNVAWKISMQVRFVVLVSLGASMQMKLTVSGYKNEIIECDPIG